MFCKIIKQLIVKLYETIKENFGLYMYSNPFVETVIMN